MPVCFYKCLNMFGFIKRHMENEDFLKWHLEKARGLVGNTLEQAFVRICS